MIARLLRFLLAPLLWSLRKLTPAPQVLAKPRAGVIVPVDRAGELYLADPTFRAAVRRRMRAAPPAERMRRAWERLLGREDYESLARKAMAAMEAERADTVRGERSRAEDAMRRDLAEIVERERAAGADLDASSSALEAEREAEARRIEEALRDLPEREAKGAIVDEMQAAGLLRTSGGVLLPTLQFMDRFAALVYQEESLGSGGAGAEGEYAEGEGHYRREPLRSAIEVSRMDVLATMLRARSRHPKVRRLLDDDVVVHREERAGILQVVLILDRSGSMEERGRMEAAKRATLALHHAVKRADPRNRVDVLLMDTSVRKATLREAWDTEPTGFTNHGAAFRLARALCERDGRTLVYVITDGLPEAYTKEGHDVAGHPDKAMAYARQEARLLARERGLEGFVMLLLEPKDERYVKAAEALAAEAHGRVVAVDPAQLARALLKSFERRDAEAIAAPRPARGADAPFRGT
jgi:Mg-chelatase subunit ChlD